MKREEFKITLSLSVDEVNQLAGLTALINAFKEKRGDKLHFSETEALALAVTLGLKESIEKEAEFYRSFLEKPQSERDGEEGDVPTRNPAPDEQSETIFVSEAVLLNASLGGLGDVEGKVAYESG